MIYYIGLDLGGTNIKCGVVDDQGRVLAKQSVPTHADEGPEAVIQQMAESARVVVSEAGLEIIKIKAVGIGSPGPIDFERGLLAAAPNMPLFRGVPIRDRIAQILNLPVALENDANASAIGEYWIGAGRGGLVRHLIVLTLGTGIGGGVIMDGRIVHGAFGNAGEPGHIIVVPGGRPCGCGQSGCLETYSSASRTGQRATEALEAGEASSLREVHARGEVTAKDVFQAAAAGDALANRIVDETALYLGVGCVNLCRLLDPELIVLAGGMVQAGGILLDRVRKAFASHSWKMATDRVRIVPTELGDDAGIIGAAAVAWSQTG